MTVTLGSTTEPGDWLDVTAAGLSKASGLEVVRRRLRVAPEHTIAVGDGHNDLPMFEWAARAVAMGNRCPRQCPSPRSSRRCRRSSRGPV